MYEILKKGLKRPLLEWQTGLDVKKLVALIRKNWVFLKVFLIPNRTRAKSLKWKGFLLYEKMCESCVRSRCYIYGFASGHFQLKKCGWLGLVASGSMEV